MRDITSKFSSKRTAIARAILHASPETVQRVRAADIPKGDPLPVAKVAAIQAAKKTTEWIPYCHNIPIEHVRVDFELDPDKITVDVEVSTIAKTGVEMEAITAAAAAVITLYDMLKMIDDEMEIGSVRLLSKTGGKSDFVRVGSWCSTVVVVSDRASRGEYDDVSGKVLAEGLTSHGAVGVERVVVPDEVEQIRQAVQNAVNGKSDVIIVSGGTGVGPRDVTPEAVQPMIQVPLPGIVQAFQSYSRDRIPTAILARPLAGLVETSIVVAIPGSPGAAKDALGSLFPSILHAKHVLTGGSHE